ncbi:MAG: hypothetical protein IT566_10810 [Rhodospirillaceae bacterium]|nr:hypothetical protein [Rhodospirillaceae bacterium]
MIEVAQILCKHHPEAVTLHYEPRTFGAWVPQPAKCHENAETIAKLDSAFQIVRGWLCYVMADVPVFFDAHSVVARDGNLFDFTPPVSDSSPPYRLFLPHPAEAAPFETIVFEQGQNRIHATWVLSGETWLAEDLEIKRLD